MTVSKAYSDLFADRVQAGDSKDCGVVALAIACNIEYTTAMDVLRAYGRPDNCGTPWNAMLSALREYDFGAFRITRTRKHWGGVSTVLKKLRPNRTYLVYTRKHIFCVKGGEIHDWSADKQHRILHVWQILPI